MGHGKGKRVFRGHGRKRRCEFRGCKSCSGSNIPGVSWSNGVVHSRSQAGHVVHWTFKNSSIFACSAWYSRMPASKGYLARMQRQCPFRTVKICTNARTCSNMQCQERRATATTGRERGEGQKIYVPRSMASDRIHKLGDTSAWRSG